MPLRNKPKKGSNSSQSAKRKNGASNSHNLNKKRLRDSSSDEVSSSSSSSSSSSDNDKNADEDDSSSSDSDVDSEEDESADINDKEEFDFADDNLPAARLLIGKEVKIPCKFFGATYARDQQELAGITVEKHIIKRFYPKQIVRERKSGKYPGVRRFFKKIFLGKQIAPQNYWCFYDPDEDEGRGAWSAVTYQQLLRWENNLVTLSEAEKAIKKKKNIARVVAHNQRETTCFCAACNIVFVQRLS